MWSICNKYYELYYFFATVQFNLKATLSGGYEKSSTSKCCCGVVSVVRDFQKRLNINPTFCTVLYAPISLFSTTKYTLEECVKQVLFTWNVAQVFEKTSHWHTKTRLWLVI